MNEYEVFQSGSRKGQPKHLRDRIIKYLLTVGYQSTDKPFKFQSPTDDKRFAFIGKNGSVRIGKNKSISVSITERIRKWMDEFEKSL